MLFLFIIFHVVIELLRVFQCLRCMKVISIKHLWTSIWGCCNYIQLHDAVVSCYRHRMQGIKTIDVKLTMTKAWSIQREETLHRKQFTQLPFMNHEKSSQKRRDKKWKLSILNFVIVFHRLYPYFLVLIYIHFTNKSWKEDWVQMCYRLCTIRST